KNAPFGVHFLEALPYTSDRRKSGPMTGSAKRFGSVVNDDPVDRQSRTGTEPAGESASRKNLAEARFFQLNPSFGRVGLFTIPRF
ncbi:MAG: hypothetical protein IJT49_08395, partial [Clostridia bacterium]|nr:hypothetical protein [Clostridia bacterium]